MTPSGVYLRRLAALGAGLLVYWLMMATLPRTGQGVLLLLHGLAALLVGTAIAYRGRQDNQGRRTAAAASLVLMLWGLAATGWLIPHFHRRR